jgi:hypothetical protein
MNEVIPVLKPARMPSAGRETVTKVVVKPKLAILVMNPSDTP